MPCDHGYDEIDQRRVDAITAMLCGVLCQKPEALRLAHEWFPHHRKIDEAQRRNQHSAAVDARMSADRVLDEAYRILCT